MNIDKISNNLLQKLNIDEKIELIHGKDEWNFNVPFSLLNKTSFKVSDGPLGLRTVNEQFETIKSIAFPSMATLSCSFDKNMLFEYGRTLADIAKYNQVNAILGPGLNIKRNPLNGRNFEYLSEDPILSGKLSGYMSQGIESKGIASCLKHFILNNSEKYRYVSSANCDMKAFNEIYLRNFKIANRIGHPSMIMTSYNRFNRLRVNENIDLLNKFREVAGFDGLYISDWSAIDNPNNFYKSNQIEMPFSLEHKKIDLNNSDILESIDKTAKEEIRTILKFNKKYKTKVDFNDLHNKSALMLANCTVLLKNENEILPLHPLEKILVVGSLANDPYYQGGGSSKVNSYKVDQFTDELDSLGIKYDYKVGYDDTFTLNKKYIIDAIKDASKYDKILLFIGNPPLTEKENQDRNTLELPKIMEELFEQLYMSNKNIIVILETGSPVTFKNIDQARAILLPYLGGEAINRGLIYNLYGVVPPSGRLSETWPIKLEDTPIFESITDDPLNINYLESIYVGYRYYDKACKNTLFSFGEGLSYSLFKIKSFKCVSNNKYLNFKVRIKNIGEFDSKTPILLYYTKENSNTFREEKALIDFEKIYLRKDETKTVEFKIPFEDLEVYDINEDKMILEDGDYIFKIGFDSHNLTNELKVNINSKEYIKENYNNLFKSYSKLKNNKFTLNDFNNLSKGEFYKEIRPISKDSLLDELNQNEESIKLKELLLSKIEQFKIDNPRLQDEIETYRNAPIRILNTYFKLIDDSLLDDMIKAIRKE